MNSSSVIYLEKIQLKHEKEYLRAVKKSITSLEPWIEVIKTRKAFLQLISAISKPEDKAYLIRRSSDDALIGTIEIRDIFMGHFKCGYLIYYAFDGFRGQGYMKEALSLTITKAFKKFKLHRLEANIQPSNKASIGLAKAAGLLYEGYSPKFLKINGDWRDHERWALINDKV
jgi:ribosomal-protein-alanine N-acetyltransferase